MITLIANSASLAAPVLNNPAAVCYFALAAVYGVTAYFYHRHAHGMPLALCAGSSSALHGALGTFSVAMPH